MGSGYFQFNASCQSVYQDLISLKLDQGNRRLISEREKNPDNLAWVFLQDYVDFLSLYISDNEPLYHSLKGNKELRLEKLQDGDRKSAWYLYTQAEIRVHWAVMAIRYGDYLSAVFDIRKALQLLEENSKKHPDFKPNRKSLGLLHALLGSIPEKYKWGMSLLGLHGDLEQGFRELEKLVMSADDDSFLFAHETQTLYAFLLLHLRNEGNKAWHFLMSKGFPRENNLMDYYTCAHIGLYSRHNKETLVLLSKAPFGPAYPTFDLLYYLRGLSKLYSLDLSAAADLNRFLQLHKGKNYLKSSLQKLGWIELLKENKQGYLQKMEEVKSRGNSHMDADKQALREAQSGRAPQLQLLRCRLLFDGGYFQPAEQELERLNEKELNTADDQAEWYYRQARLFHETGRLNRALQLYDKTIEKGRYLSRYFAPNAAFEAGLICEQQKLADKAAAYFNLCLSFESHEYKNGLDQKARAGLERLGR
jgi:hypothetical protein